MGLSDEQWRFEQQHRADEGNPFELLVEQHAEEGADCCALSQFDPLVGVVVGQAHNSKTGGVYSGGVIGSVDEAMECKYPLYIEEDEEELIAFAQHVRGSASE